MLLVAILDNYCYIVLSDEINIIGVNMLCCHVALKA